MDLHIELQRGHSAPQNAKISKWVGHNKERFKELVYIFMEGDHKVSLRAGWVINLIAEDVPEMIKPHISDLVKYLIRTNIPVASKRNIVRLLQFVEVPNKLHVDVINACFDFLLNPKEPIAVRVFSMTVLAKLSKFHPDIKTELKATIENILEIEDASAGFKNRAGKLFKSLR